MVCVYDTDILYICSVVVFKYDNLKKEKAAWTVGLQSEKGSLLYWILHILDGYTSNIMP